MQRSTVAFNFLCALLGLLYEGRHLSSSVRRKITVNVFYSTSTNVFKKKIFVTFLTFFKRFFIFGGTLFSSMVMMCFGCGCACSAEDVQPGHSADEARQTGEIERRRQPRLSSFHRRQVSTGHRVPDGRLGAQRRM